MKPYLALLRHVLRTGEPKSDRTGTGTHSVFSAEMRFDLANGFPLVTTKHVSFKNIVAELLWFLQGDTNVRTLQTQGVKIWDEWAREDGSLGPVYGAQWRSWKTVDDRVIDQMSQVVDQIRVNPDSRRLIVSAWNVGEIEQMALPPCHLLFQFYVVNGRLSCKLIQRSADLFLGVPYNIASYALLTMMVAQVTGLQPGEFIWSGGDCHIYDNHVRQVKTQLRRTPRPLPKVHLNPEITDLFAFTRQDITLEGYDPHPPIKAPVAV